jgi:aminopeptidase N
MRDSMRLVALLGLLATMAGAQAGDGWLGPRPHAGTGFLSRFARQRYEGAMLADSLHDYNVRHYRVALDLPMTDSSYSGHSRICLRSDIPALDSVVLDFGNLVCDSVQRAGTALVYRTPTNKLTVLLDAPLGQGDSTVLDIWFRRLNVGPLLGYYFARPPRTSFAYCHTCTPPRDCRYWMPCFDEPLDKAERGIELVLTVPDSFQTCANGTLDSVTFGAGKATYWWRHPYGIATYLITFSASRFEHWRQWLPTGSGDSVPSDYYLWPQDTTSSRLAFQRVPQMMRYFSDSLRFGTYPFERYGMTVGYFSFPWGGMENQTMVMINRQWLNGNDDDGIAHEMSHMWYGDMVTCVDFRDVWLNEGFATWAEAQYMGWATSRPNFNSIINAQTGQALGQDRRLRFALYGPPEAEIYNYGTIYCKGALVMRMLQQAVGDTAWQQPGILFRALRAYADSFRYGTASSHDLRRIVERQAGVDLGWFFDDWVFSAGIPRYGLNWYPEPAGDSWRVITTLSQNNGAGAPAVFRQPVPVRLNCGAESTFITLRPQANPQTDTFVLSVRPLSLSWDPDNWVLDSVGVTGIGEPARHPPVAPRVLTIAPSPARGAVRFSFAATCRELQLFDRSGRLVQRLAAAGRQQVVWDRTLIGGGPAPAGVYYCRVPGADSGPLVKFVLTD